MTSGKEKAFYGDTLGVDVTEEYGMLTLRLAGGQRVLIYPKDDHQPATYTVLNFEVNDVDAAVNQLSAAGVTFERYEGVPHDERGIVRQWGPPDRLVQGPGRQHPVCDPDRLSSRLLPHAAL